MTRVCETLYPQNILINLETVSIIHRPKEIGRGERSKEQPTKVEFPILCNDAIGIIIDSSVYSRTTRNPRLLLLG